MTILTPNFADRQKANGGAGAPLHISPAHEPTREGEQPQFQTYAERPNPSLQIVPGPINVVENKPLKVALIGTAPSSRMLAPFNDPSWQIWACSPGNMNSLPRVDVWFELHSNLLWPEHESYGRPYIEWLKQQPFPVYMQDQAQVPRATIFPMYDMVMEFGRSFFTSSFAWMMALAIKMGASEIALYGIDMASRDEYILQRPGFFFFRHEAEKRGIKVSAPHESDIMQDPPLYAYVDSTPFGRKLRARTQEVMGRIAPMEQQHAQIGNSITYLKGAKEDLDYVESIWSGVSTDLVLQQQQIVMRDAEIAALKAKIAELMSPKMMLAAETAPPIIRRRRRKQAQPPQPEPTVTTESPNG